ncbi:MAG: YgiT-type zinc finger protein [Armatimonadetes bacterium]|nr:YgiT-type zinc finger protein [Armatimonadota bacterium]
MKTTCFMCGGRLTTARVRVVRQRGDEIGLFDAVPAKVCEHCGEQYVGLKAARGMETAMAAPEKPSRTVKVPVYALQEA